MRNGNPNGPPTGKGADKKEDGDREKNARRAKTSERGVPTG